jgi:hypothetical protein
MQAQRVTKHRVPVPVTSPKSYLLRGTPHSGRNLAGLLRRLGGLPVSESRLWAVSAAQMESIAAPKAHGGMVVRRRRWMPTATLCIMQCVRGHLRFQDGEAAILVSITGPARTRDPVAVGVPHNGNLRDSNGPDGGCCLGNCSPGQGQPKVQ